MKKLFIQAYNHPLIAGSSIVFIGSFIGNVLSYFFNLSMLRLLPVADYGLLTSLTSLLALIGILQLSLVGIFAKFSATYKAKKDEEGFAFLINSGIRFAVFASLLLLLILLLLSPLLMTLTKSDDIILIFLASISVSVALIFAFPVGILQGELKFWKISFLNILSPVIKIIVGVALVYIGYSVTGALLGVFTAALIPLFLGIYIIKKEHPRKNVKKVDTGVFLNEFKSYSARFLLASIAISVITNADILLVRGFFEPVVSGQYAALSLMGKAIFYLTSPIFFVFFPLIAQKDAKREKIKNTLYLTCGIVFLVSFNISAIYFLFPNLILAIFAPNPSYQALIPFIGPFSLYILVFSVANVFNNYFLSSGKTYIYKINVSIAILFILLVIIFHSSLFQIIAVLFVCSILLLILYLWNFFRHNE